MKSRASELVAQLAAGVDVERVLRDMRLTPGRALRLLNSRPGRRQLGARKRLAQVHAHLVAHRFSSFAVHRLCELLSSEKPELRLKGAVSVLQIAGVGRNNAPRKAAKKAASGEGHVLTAEEQELVDALAGVMNEKKKAELKEGAGGAGDGT